MTEQFTFRPITPQDQEFLLGVYASTREEELAQVDWSRAQKNAFVQMQFEAQHKYYVENYPGAQLQVILVQGEPAGRLYIKRLEKEIRIMDIALLPAFRNRGLGTEIIKQILTEGQACDVPVTIHVERFNPALRLYTRLGFRLLEDKGVYLLMEWNPNAGLSTIQ
jgi:ribosomal protein S18 acetylase RimI-like enzyme